MTDVVEESPLIADTIKEEVNGVKNTINTNTTLSKSNLIRFAVIGICILVVMYMMYYVYCKFYENSLTEHFIQKQERDDTAAEGYNLHKEIEILKNIQNGIISQLSNVYD